MEHTKSTEVKLYLASSNLVIRVNKPLKIGRTAGDVIIEEDEALSAIHCEVIPRIMSLSIKDLASFNGVFVNKTKIMPHTETMLTAGDEVIIGGQTFTFLDSEESLLQKYPKPDRRKSSRPKSLFAPINLLNFHYAPLKWRALYVVGILATIASVVLNAQLTHPLPNDLQFLSGLYHEQIIASGLKAVALVWALGIAHSFLLAHYLNRNIARRVFAFASYAVLLFLAVDLKNGPLSPIKTYVESREAIIKEDLGEKSILRLRAIADLEARLKLAFPLISHQLEGDRQLELAKDFAKLTRKIEHHRKQIGKL